MLHLQSLGLVSSATRSPVLVYTHSIMLLNVSDASACAWTLKLRLVAQCQSTTLRQAVSTYVWPGGMGIRAGTLIGTPESQSTRPAGKPLMDVTSNGAVPVFRSVNV